MKSTILQRLGVLVVASVGFFGSMSAYAGLTCEKPLCVEKLVTSTGGVKIFARDWGALFPNRPTILFAHGFPHSDIIWQDQVKSLLSIKYRIITVDLRGHGASEKPTTADQYAPALLADDIKSVLNAFNVSKAVLVGHSYGGAPISDFSFFGNNNRIRGLVYVDASPSLNDQLAGVPVDASAAIGLTLPGPTGDPTYASFAEGNKVFLNLSYAPIIPPIGEATDIRGLNYLVLPVVRLALVTGEPPAFTAQMNAYTAGLVTQKKIPVLVVYGGQDQIVDPQVFADLATHIVGSKKIVYPSQGHLPQLTNSLQFNLDLDDFIDRNCN